MRAPVMDREPCPYEPLHRYSEASARAKLTRHRLRREDGWTAAGCPGTEHWHVLSPEQSRAPGGDPDPLSSDDTRGGAPTS